MEISDDAPLEFPVAGSERTSTPIKPTVWSRTCLIHAYALIVQLFRIANSLVIICT